MVIIRTMICNVETARWILTGPQVAFARRHGAVAGSASPLGGTFFYGPGLGVLWRWLVRPDGLVAEIVSFREDRPYR
jgi:hypothetical protein